MTYLQYLL